MKNTLLSAMLLGLGELQATTLQVIPAAPRYQEAVVARIGLEPMTFGFIYGATTEMSGNVITVTYHRFPEIAKEPHDVTLGQLPAGHYSVLLRNATSGEVEASASFTVAPSEPPGLGTATAVPSVNFTGQWWNPAEPGWGLAITQGPTNVVWAEWYVYDPTGNPTWYTLEPGYWITAASTFVYSGTVSRYTGAPWSGSYARPSRTVVGTGELSFNDAFNGTLNFVVDGVRTIKPIARLPIE